MLTISKLNRKLLKILPLSYFESLDHGKKHADDLLLLAKEIVQAEMLELDEEVLVCSIFIHDLFAHVGEKHGDLAVKYFCENIADLFNPTQCKKICEAVLFHDEKNISFIEIRKNQFLESKLLYDIDNIDAFGVKGIYRYIKIYASRLISIDLMAKLVSENITSRYNSLCFEHSKKMSYENYMLSVRFFTSAMDHNSVEFWILEWIYKYYKLPIKELIDKVKKSINELNKKSKLEFVNQFFDTLYHCYK